MPAHDPVRDPARDPAHDPVRATGAAQVDAYRAGPSRTVGPAVPAGPQMRDLAHRRARGAYQVDEFGFDAEFTERLIAPLFRPLYRSWFRVAVQGLPNVPTSGVHCLLPTTPGPSRWMRS